MNPERFDGLSRDYAAGAVSRRATLKGLAFGGVAAFFGSRFAGEADAAAKCDFGVCAKKNWCENREHVCGPTGGNGKCFVKRFGGRNICAEILFQAASCDDCKSPNCVDCVCVLGAGGGDKCNNGATGYDYVCVRKV
jgi:hypothetical protein